MTSSDFGPGALDTWIATVDRRHRKRRIIAATLKNESSGVFTLPLRFVLKVAEVGPARASRMAASVVMARLGRR